MGNRKLLALIVMLSMGCHTYAANSAQTLLDGNDGWVASISSGSAWSHNGTTQSFYLTPAIEKTYAAKRTYDTQLIGELFYGIRKQITQQASVHLGLEAAAMSEVELKGDIWDDADPQFNNYDYKYKVYTKRLALKAKLLFDNGCQYIPWINGSIGVSANRSYDFVNTPAISQAVINPNFTSHTTLSLAYTVGVGIQRKLTRHWQVGVGYEFADWGKTELQHASNQTLNSGLSLNHFYSNQILFNFTYLS